MNQKSKLIIVTGQPGSGKTTLSKELGKLLHLPIISRDEIKEGYVNTFDVPHHKLPEDTNKAATEIFFRIIELLVSNNVSLIAEAAFQHKTWEPRIARLKNYAATFIIICELDAELAARRHLQRGLSDPKREFFHGDNRVTHFKKTGEFLPPEHYEPPSIPEVRTIRVSTLNEYDPALEDLIHSLRRLFMTSV